MKHFVFTAIILSSAHAWALSQAQQNLTPGAGQNEIQIGAPYTHASYSNSSATATATGYMGAVTYSYGFSENHSLAVGVGYGSLKTKIDPALGVSPLVELGVVVPTSGLLLGGSVKAKLPFEGDGEISSSGLTESAKITGGNVFTASLALRTVF